MQKRDRVQQRVDALDRAQFADEHQIGGVRRRRHRFELGLADAVRDDAHQPQGGVRISARNTSALNAL